MLVDGGAAERSLTNWSQLPKNGVSSRPFYEFDQCHREIVDRFGWTIAHTSTLKGMRSWRMTGLIKMSYGPISPELLGFKSHFLPSFPWSL